MTCPSGLLREWVDEQHERELGVPEIEPGIVDDDVVRELVRRGLLVHLVWSVPPPRRNPPTLDEIARAVEKRYAERGLIITRRVAHTRARELLRRDALPRWVRPAVDADRAERAERRRRRR